MLWQAPGDANSVLRGVVLREEITDERGDPRCLVLSSNREIWMPSAELTLDHLGAASAAALREQVSALLTTIEHLVSGGEVAEASATATVLAWLLADQSGDEAPTNNNARPNSESARAANKAYDQLNSRSRLG